jgi:Molybdopterin converting factor, small subunit
MMVKLVFLGKLRGDGRDDLAVPPNVMTLADLKDWLAHRDPALGAALATTRTHIVLNQEIVHDMALPIGDGDEVAFLPPMSGG